MMSRPSSLNSTSSRPGGGLRVILSRYHATEAPKPSRRWWRSAGASFTVASSGTAPAAAGDEPGARLMQEVHRSSTQARGIRMGAHGSTGLTGSGAGGSVRRSTCDVDDDGYRLWLRYDPIGDQARRAELRAGVTAVFVEGADSSPTLLAAKEELEAGIAGLAGSPLPGTQSSTREGVLVAGTAARSPLVAKLGFDEPLARVGDEGFVIGR